MGANIPLPALDIRPTQAPSVLDTAARVEQLKGMRQAQQEREVGLQMQQQQLRDQQALTQSMLNWDGNSYDDLAKSVLKNGGSANAAMAVQQHGIQLRTQLATMQKDQLANLAQRHDLALGAIKATESMPDDQLGQHVANTVHDLMGRGLLDPQEGQQYLDLATLPPDQLRSQLALHEKQLLGEQQQISNAAKEAEIGKNTSEATKNAALTSEAQATTEKTQKETQLMQQYGFSSPAQLEMKFLSEDMKRRRGQPYDADFVNSYKGMKTLVPVANFNLQNAGMTGGGGKQPSAIAQGLANGSMKWQDVVSARTPASVKEALLQEVKSINPNFNSGDFTVGQKEKEYMTSGKGGQQLTAFNTAIAHLDLLDKLADDLHNTNLQVVNKAKQAWATQTGNPAPANFEAAKNAMSGEVAAALKASGATDEEIANVGATFSRAQGPAQLRGAINTYRTLLTSKAGNLKAQYEQGVQAKPNFGTEDQPKGGGAMKITLPSGKQITIE